MFEARLVQGNLLKKLVDALKELVTEVNWDVSPEGISMQAMDSSHVCLTAFKLDADGFDHFRCDRNLSLGVSMVNLAKILKCAGNDDVVTMRANDDGDTLSLMFESGKQDRVSDFDLKLMSIESDQLGIPDQDHSAECRMPSAEYTRICRDLASIGDTVLLSATKEGIKFSTAGDIGTANITLRHATTADKEEDNITINLNEPVALTFALRYLNNFSKAAPLSSHVKLSLTKDLPIVVEYPIENMGYVKYFLAPKIEDDEGEDEAQS
eukprot:gene17547-23871_t